MCRAKIICSLLAIVGCVLSACSEWNTESLGSKFVPSNSQVRAFTHLVYVEYTADGARVWGPAAGEVTASVNDLHVAIDNTGDSLAIFAYGYPAAKDTLALVDATLSVKSPSAYALYMGGLSLRGQSGPVFESVGDAPCYVVLPQGSKNQLYGHVEIGGPLYVTGRGALTIDAQSTCLTAASLQCQYGVTVTINSAEGDGIALSGPMRSSQGTWTINARQHAVTSPDSIVLIAGTYKGTAEQGAFFHAGDGVVVRRPTLMTASNSSSHIIDSTLLAMRYDSIQPIWEACIDTLNFEADSTYNIYVNQAKTSSRKFVPQRSVAKPWFLVSDGVILSSDTLHFVRGKR